ncbi:MAG: site-specific integrase [Pseudomonadota bacterium]
MRNFVGKSQIVCHDDCIMILNFKDSLLSKDCYTQTLLKETAPDAKNPARHSCAFGSAGGSGAGAKTMSRDRQNHGEAASLFDATGRRKYLNADERERFVSAAATFSPRIKALCLLLHYTGCRISEALALEAHHLDAADGLVILQTLKQRRRGVYRSVPVPQALIEALTKLNTGDDTPIFGWHRSTAWEKICAVFAQADVTGPHATPRGARHGFGVAAVSAGVPVTLVQRWLGHSRLETTSIYLAVTGPEERNYACKLWAKSGFLRTARTPQASTTTQEKEYA